MISSRVMMVFHGVACSMLGVADRKQFDFFYVKVCSKH